MTEINQRYVDIPAQDCIWKELLHHETHPAHPSASSKSLDKREVVFVIICISQ